jgi:hypothetical protein
VLVLVLWRPVIFPLVVSFDLNPLTIRSNRLFQYRRIHSRPRGLRPHLRADYLFSYINRESRCTQTSTRSALLSTSFMQFDRYLVLPISSSLRPNPNTCIFSPRILGPTSHRAWHAKYSTSHRQALVTPLVEAMTLTLNHASLLDDMGRWQFL